MSQIEQVDKPWLWKPGQSPRNGGRSPGVRDVRNLARAWTMEALATIKMIMDDETQGGSVRLAAANSILDRAWGKPEQAMKLAHVDDVDVERMKTSDLKKLLLESLGTKSIEGELIEVKEGELV